MGLATRVIPVLLARGDELVKGKRFDAWRSVGHVLQAAHVHAARGVDELVVLDIAATREGRGPNLALVEKICRAMFTPVTVGGGVRNVQDVRDLLAAGADKVAICTHWNVIGDAADKFGRQAIVAAIDANKGFAWTHAGTVAVRWGDMPNPVDVEYVVKMVAGMGAGEILLTSIAREGTMEGYDLELIRRVAPLVTVPVIANGGCGTYLDMLDALAVGAHAVAAGAMFQFTDQTPRGASRYLAQRGVEVRL
jgi:imidazole glycerol-phosphate synthase subunit HisF